MLPAGAVVLITGATGGIGGSVSRRLLADGHRLVVSGRDPERTQAAARRLGPAAHAEVADLCQLQAPGRLVDAVLQRFGRLDALVDCAGVGHAGALADMSPERVAQLVATNVQAPLLLARACLPTMRAQGGGHLVFVTSIAGLLGVPQESVYSATKAGLELFAEVLAAEQRAHGIRVSTVAPGVVDTGFFHARGRPYTRRFPRPVPPDRVAQAVTQALAGTGGRRVVPRWLELPIRVRAWAPGTYRRLERRAGIETSPGD